jgi:hypothetical protein
MLGTSFEVFVAEVKKLIAAAEMHEVELPSLGSFKAALDDALVEVTASKRQQVRLMTKSIEATQELYADIAACRDLALRLKSLVRAGFDPADERLADFGMKIRGRRRKSRELEKKTGSPGYH